MNRISNKHKKNVTGDWYKHPKPSMKKVGNGKLRQWPLEVEEDAPKQRGKKDKRFRAERLCPFCLSNIFVQYIGATVRHYGSCKECGALKQGARRCPHCKSDNIWLLGDVLMCKNCGKKRKKDE